MWTSNTTRRELLAIVQGERSGSSLDVRRQDDHILLDDKPAELQMIWREEPGDRPRLPSAIIVDCAARRDLFAWVATYLPILRPFTAHCRVLTRESAKAGLARTGSPKLDAFEGACLGLIFGETATYVAGRAEISQLSLTACASSYSFAMTRAFALDRTLNRRQEIADAWSQARNLTKQQKLGLGVDRLTACWCAMMDLEASGVCQSGAGADHLPKQVAQACQDIRQSGDIDRTRWEVLTEELFEVRASREGLYGPREARVRSVERALQWLSEHKPQDVSASFAAGYLLSRISPGTFEHYGIALPFLQALPEMFVWYGLCAGLSERSELLNQFAGLGRRIVREVYRNEDILDSPRCDIAIGELEVLASGTDARLDFRTGDRGYIDVELAPCVNVVMRWPPHTTVQEESRTARSDAGRQTELFATSAAGKNEVGHLLAELDTTLDSLRRFRDRLSGAAPPDQSYKGKSSRKKRK